MKCPACWAEKAYRRTDEGSWAGILRYLLFVPMRCRHCYHKFYIHRMFAFGKVIEPPAKLRPAPPPEALSFAARHVIENSAETSEQTTVRRRSA